MHSGLHVDDADASICTMPSTEVCRAGVILHAAALLRARGAEEALVRRAVAGIGGTWRWTRRSKEAGRTARRGGVAGTGGAPC
jgi:hypothetical protein